MFNPQRTLSLGVGVPLAFSLLFLKEPFIQTLETHRATVTYIVYVGGQPQQPKSLNTPVQHVKLHHQQRNRSQSLQSGYCIVLPPEPFAASNPDR